jgi:hypothetical protein
VDDALLCIGELAARANTMRTQPLNPCPGDAIAVLRAAIALWHGPPITDKASTIRCPARGCLLAPSPTNRNHSESPRSWRSETPRNSRGWLCRSVYN